MIADLDGDRRVRHREVPQLGFDRRGELGADLPASAAHDDRRGSFVGERLLSLLVELGGALVESFEFAQTIGRLDVEFHHRGEVVAVLAAEVLEELATLAQERQALG